MPWLGRTKDEPKPPPIVAAVEAPEAPKEARPPGPGAAAKPKDEDVTDRVVAVVNNDAITLGELQYSKATSLPIRVVLAVQDDSPVQSVADLPAGVRMYTGDDFNYPELIAGNPQGYSDALVGIFDAIAPAAAAALGALARGDSVTFHAILAPTVPLSRHIFKAPTRFYKSGVVFMAYLNGLQNHFTMIAGQESTRSTLHLAELFRLADAAGLLADPDIASQRMRLVMATRGVH